MAPFLRWYTRCDITDHDSFLRGKISAGTRSTCGIWQADSVSNVSIESRATRNVGGVLAEA